MIQQLNGNPVAAQPLTRTARLNDRLHRLAVCSWSLQPACPEDLVEKLVSTGIRQIQLALAPFREAPKIWVYAEHLFRAHDIKIISGMIDCIGEDYSTLETIRQTGGIAPDALWHRNIENMHLAAMRAQTLGLQLVSFHAGFFPNDERDPAYAKMCQRLHEVASVFQKYGIVIGLETGQETAFELAQVLRQINHPNLGVNFDPANMILYDKGDPLAALHVPRPGACTRVLQRLRVSLSRIQIQTHRMSVRVVWFYPSFILDPCYGHVRVCLSVTVSLTVRCSECAAGHPAAGTRCTNFTDIRCCCCGRCWYFCDVRASACATLVAAVACFAFI